MNLVKVVLCASFLFLAPHARAVINGEPDGESHQQVGEVYNAATSCSGTLIAPDVFLTAGHCTDALTFFEDVHGLEASVSFAEHVQWPSPDLAVTGWVTHPKFFAGTTTSEFVEFDVGLVFLAQPVAGVELATLPESRAVRGLEKRALLEIVGFGAPVLDSRHAAFVVLRNANERNAVLEDQLIRFSQSPGHDLGGGCFGDSGGPIFRASTLEILAVSSGGNPNCTGVALGQRLDHPEILSWIEAQLAARE
jgi:hypothetical protein